MRKTTHHHSGPPAGRAERLPGRPSRELLFLAGQLWLAPQQLSLVAPARGSDQVPPEPPEWIPIAGRLARLLADRPDLRRSFGIEEGLIEAMLDRQADLRTLGELALALAAHADAGRLVIGEALARLGGEVVAAAARIEADPALDPARREAMGTFPRLRAGRHVRHGRGR